MSTFAGLHGSFRERVRQRDKESSDESRGSVYLSGSSVAPQVHLSVSEVDEEEITFLHIVSKEL